jgi:hypothetical protein
LRIICLAAFSAQGCSTLCTESLDATGFGELRRNERERIPQVKKV